ncbi:lincosamide nucleotidyltransferase A/C/D/E [Pseudonocardia sediminis]|uniref:Lincosamide nucleotidyltransferase A/C/D/E n=2 Tax=Pseudonocardia sediminis TaxID=1397368 RepID=A0A4Q7UZD3_PSEST|nr:lincosamide nucleotidyltransferase A/C/D/E [Pseudonocardia sediminis]
MTAAEVVRVLDALDAAGCRYWVEGGWGVDALVGAQTRPHRDLDVDVDSRHEDRVLTTLAELGYAIETDWRPTRVELAAPGRGWVDVHPLQIADDGSARQADLDGGFWEFPARYYTTGTIAGRSVPCVSVEAQLSFHEGYELRGVDHVDLARLRRLSG